MPEHRGFGHVMLSVTDLERSADFYNRVFATQSMPGEDQHGSFIVCVGQNLMVGLRKHQSTPGNELFDPCRVGIDHLGVHVVDRTELEIWQRHLEDNGVVNSGIVEGPFGLHLNAKDPDQIPIEFFVPATES